MLQKKKVLIVEDNYDLLEEISNILQFEGYNVFSEQDGYGGIKRAHIVDPDLIICDILLPDIDGFEVCKKLKEKLSQKIIPFIFITALSDRNNFRFGMELGADDYLTKPFTRTELLKTVSVRLDRAKQTEAIILDKAPDSSGNSRSCSPQEHLKEDSSISSKERNPNNYDATSFVPEIAVDAISLLETNDIVKGIKGKIHQKLEAQCSPREKQLLVQLEKGISSPNSILNNLSLFLQGFYHRYPSFFSKLEARHSGLTRNERVLIAATFMELDTNQIASLLGITPESVRKYRYRLKKKLGLHAHDNISQYINNFNDYK